MPSDDMLAQLAAEVGIFSDFVDMQGITRVAGPDTQRALLRAAGVPADTAAEVRESLAQRSADRSMVFTEPDVVVVAGQSATVPISRPASFAVCAEDDDAVLAEGRGDDTLHLPALVPGVHILHMDDARGRQSANLISAPLRAPGIEERIGRDRTWGATAALYGLVGKRDQGLGDYTDLAELAVAVGQAGADFLGINPVHALGFAADETISPYSPSHRGFFNTDHIAVDAEVCSPDSGRIVDYAGYRASQRAALRKAHAAFVKGGDVAAHQSFDAFCRRAGEALDRFAQYESLSEILGSDWRTWPEHAAIAPPPPERMAFHKWLQWRAERQLATASTAARDAGMDLGLYLDLAVGSRRGGAESWGEGAPVARGVSLGAPPDHLSPAGQNWQLSAFAPGKLQNTRYANLRQVLRQAMRHAGVLRIDHVLGLNRSFWIPDDGSPGGYMRQPFEALMGVIRIEAARAGCVVVGEDLGLVPLGFRDTMATGGFYGYSVLQYEKDKAGNFKPVSDLRAQSLACFATHDTPTLAGYWSGRDLSWWRKLGWVTDQGAAQAKAQRDMDKRQILDPASDLDLSECSLASVRNTVHRRLASSPAAMVAVQLDDILLVEEAQNLPGTVTVHPNWQRRYPQSVAEIAHSEGLAETAGIMTRAGRSRAKQKDRR